MRRDFRSYLKDILGAGGDIARYMVGIDRETFAALSEKQPAVERKFEIIGKAIVQCRQHYPAEIVGLGDVPGSRRLSKLSRSPISRRFTGDSLGHPAE